MRIERDFLWWSRQRLHRLLNVCHASSFTDYNLKRLQISANVS